MLAKRRVRDVYFSASFFFHSAKISYGEAPLEHDASGRASRQDNGRALHPRLQCALVCLARKNQRINPLTALQQNAAAHQVKQTRPIRHREADYCGFTFLTAKRSTMLLSGSK
jgi:hypothetical protein